MTVNYRTKSGLNKATFAALDNTELVQRLTERFPSWSVFSRTYNKSHTKAASAFGGGAKYYTTLRSNETLRLVNGEALQGEIRIIDQDYSGRALTVEFGLYRLICTNGLYGFRSVSESIRITHHVGKAGILMQLDNLIVASSAVFSNMVEQANALLLAPIDYPLATLQRVALQVGLSKSTYNRIKSIIDWRSGRPEDNVNTAWGLYNVINEVDRISARRNSVAYLQRDTQVIDSILGRIAA
jgi:hypothetical protein